MDWKQEREEEDTKEAEEVVAVDSRGELFIWTAGWTWGILQVSSNSTVLEIGACFLA